MPAYPYQAFTPHKIEKMKKVFISYSKDDLEIVMSFIHSLQTLVLQNTIEQPWFCTYLAPGDEVQNKIREKMHEADIVCFMCSNNFFRTQYIIDHELKPTLKRKNEGSQQIILPIVIDRVKWIIDNPDVNLGKFSGFPYRGKPVSSFYNWNDAWYVTNWFLEEVIKKNLVNDENFFDIITKLPSDIEDLIISQIKGDLNK
ncbi:MAG: toll/interleukin-1 receptor domain-containing protein [Saprospiraceae bacterium]|nr:toll/interleukin-1 receptor domain-containing protein [Saprospiraceae bacterium]